jgi:hypothetical protein
LKEKIEKGKRNEGAREEKEQRMKGVAREIYCMMSRDYTYKISDLCKKNRKRKIPLSAHQNINNKDNAYRRSSYDS